MSLLLKRIPRTVAAMAALVGASLASHAAEPQRGAMAACATDLATLCPGLEAGGGKRIRCLTSNQSALSNPCAEAIQARRANAPGTAPATVAQAQTPAAPPAAAPAPAATAAPTTAPVAVAPKARPAAANMRACRTDLATFCGTIAPGGGRKIQCLNDNRAKLAPECAAALTNAQALKQTSRAACEADATKLCAGAKGPARQQCLVANQAQLSPDCAAAMSRRAQKAAKRAAVGKQ